MLVTAIILFLITAVFGALILSAILKNKRTPKPVVVIHGVVAMIALLLVVTYMIVNGSSTLLITSVTLFVLAALGGLVLLTIDLSKKPIPKVIALIHPIVAIAGLVILALYAMQTTN